MSGEIRIFIENWTNDENGDAVEDMRRIYTQQVCEGTISIFHVEDKSHEE